MRDNPQKRRPLAHKIGGPRAVPIHRLVARADAAIAPLYAQYDAFADQHIREVECMLESLEQAPTPEKWQSLCAAIQDLRSSSATFGAHSLSGFAQAWEKVLSPEFRERERIFAVMRVHLRSLKLAARRAMQADEEEIVKAELGRMARRLHC